MAPRIHLNLRPLREAAGLTQADLMRRSGLSQPCISRLERGASLSTTWQTLERYVDGCGATLQVEVEIKNHKRRGVK